MRTIPLIVILAAVLACALPSSALADAITDKIYTDCGHSKTSELTGTYTQAQLRKALEDPPGDASEYTTCYDAIRNALAPKIRKGGAGGSGGSSGLGGSSLGGSGLGGSGLGGGPGAGTTGGGAGGGAGGGFSGTPHVGTKAPVALGAGTALQPGVVPSIGRDAHTLPTALLVVLALLAAGTLLPATALLGRRVLARRRA